MAGIIFHLRLEGRKRIRMSCFLLVSLFWILRQTGSFSVTDPFLTTFYHVEKLNEILRNNRGRGLKNLAYPYMGVREGSKIAKIFFT